MPLSSCLAAIRPGRELRSTRLAEGRAVVAVCANGCRKDERATLRCTFLPRCCWKEKSPVRLPAAEGIAGLLEPPGRTAWYPGGSLGARGSPSLLFLRLGAVLAAKIVCQPSPVPEGVGEGRRLLPRPCHGLNPSWRRGDFEVFAVLWVETGACACVNSLQDVDRVLKFSTNPPYGNAGDPFALREQVPTGWVPQVLVRRTRGHCKDADVPLFSLPPTS